MKMTTVRLILASTSPRRRRLLEDAGIKFEVINVEVDESRVSAATPQELVMRRARLKADAAADHMDAEWAVAHRAPVAPASRDRDVVHATDLSVSRGGDGVPQTEARTGVERGVAPDTTIDAQAPGSHATDAPGSDAPGSDAPGSHATKSQANTPHPYTEQVYIIGADTVVVLDGEVLGKPVDEADARRMLARLSGRTHRVMTGIAVRASGQAARAGNVSASRDAIVGGDTTGADPHLVTNPEVLATNPEALAANPEEIKSRWVSCEDGTLVACQTTEVTMGALSAHVIGRYVATGEPLDKAGSYGIQGRGGLLVARVSGEYANVVGLPLALLRDMLAAFGVELLQ